MIQHPSSSFSGEWVCCTTDAGKIMSFHRLSIPFCSPSHGSNNQMMAGHEQLRQLEKEAKLKSERGLQARRGAPRKAWAALFRHESWQRQQINEQNLNQDRIRLFGANSTETKAMKRYQLRHLTEVIEKIFPLAKPPHYSTYPSLTQSSIQTFVGVSSSFP